MKNKRGRKAIKSVVSTDILEKWIKEDNTKWSVIKCQALISLEKGANVNEICNVLGVTRESLRIWRNIYNINGLTGLLANKDKGKKSFFSEQVKTDLLKVVGASPEIQGYERNVWDGKMVCQYMKDKWDIEISIRTAQTWLNKLDIRKEKRQRISFNKST